MEADHWNNLSAFPAIQRLAKMDTSLGRPSLIYSCLPHLVQRSMPRIPSLRRAASQYAHMPSYGHRRDASDSSVGSITPPPSYHARAESSDSEDEMAANFSSASSSRPSTSGFATPLLAEDKDTEDSVRWKYARLGQTLLAQAIEEDTSLVRNNQHFVRQLYVDSLVYLLQGLPTELEREETLRLATSLPASLTTQLSAMDDRNVVPAHCELQAQGTSTKPEQPEDDSPSVLHQTVSGVTLYAFLVFSFLLPYLQLLMRGIYCYDRRYKVSDRLLAQSVLTADILSKQALVLAGNVSTWNDGKIGDGLRDVGIWWVRGLTGGLHEGLGKGMRITGTGADHRGRRNKTVRRREVEGRS